VAGPCVREVWEEYGSFLRSTIRNHPNPDLSCHVSFAGPQSGTIRIQTSPAMSLSQACVP
ncbi:hypothetical protein AK812_SmicGene46235, partial [Symbiodinium microadriaticum]